MDSHQATIMLFDPSTGRPTCVMDGNSITAHRTAAAGAIGIDLLARADSTCLCVFGTGAQARMHTQYALRVRPSITHVQYVTRDERNCSSFEKQFSDQHEVRHAKDTALALTKSDVVITATPATRPLFETASIRPGTHLSCVGADTVGKRELPPELADRATFFVDDLIQARSIGEMQWLPNTDATEIGAIVVADTNIERSTDDITVFDMTGIALQDLAVASALLQEFLLSESTNKVSWPW